MALVDAHIDRLVVQVPPLADGYCAVRGSSLAPYVDSRLSLVLLICHRL